MKNKDQSVTDGIRELTTNSRITEDFWNMVRSIAAQHGYHGTSQGATVTEGDVDDWAGDFILVLRRRGPAATEAITTLNVLRREFAKWITHKRDPQKKQLWKDISTALLKLETEGIVERPPEQRKHNNSNYTLWSLKGNINITPKYLSEKEVAALAPKLSKHRPAKQILKISESKTWVQSLLQETKGALSMNDIVNLLESHVELTKITDYPPNSPQQEKDDDSPTSWKERIAALQISPDLEAGINQTIEYIVTEVWREVGAVSHGRKVVVYGHRILCCYWLPKNIFNRKVTLEQFGPTSTVQDVERDISQICSEYIPAPDNDAVDDSDRLSCLRVAAGVLEGLAERCSEKGFCEFFNIDQMNK